MDGLPLRLFNHVNLQGQGESAAAMPSHDNDERNFTFLLNYPSTNSSHANTRAPGLDFEDQNISFQGVTAVILPSSRLDESRSPDEPLIVLYMANSAMLPILENYWGGIENAWRMNRLLRCPLWLYIDLLQAYGHLSDVWGVVGHDLAWRNMQAYRETSRSSTLLLTRRLHKATSNVITLRENLRLHISSTELFQKYVQKMKRSQSLPMPDDYQVPLRERTSELLQEFRHHWATSEVILEQFKSLMSLVFNTETVAQGQAVARLNLLAFAFLPLSFVTGIFGMTTWTISATWYPLWAFLALVLLTIATYIVGKISVEDRGGSSLLSRLHWGPAQSPTADVESRSGQKPLASRAMAPTAVVTDILPPSAPTQTSFQRMGSYGHSKRGSRWAKRQVQRAERDADTITPPSAQSHSSQTSYLPYVHLVLSDIADVNSGGGFSTGPIEASATFPPNLPEARTVSDRHSAIEMNHPHYASGAEGSDVKNHVAFEEHRKHQEGLGLAYGPSTEAADHSRPQTIDPSTRKKVQVKIQKVEDKTERYLSKGVKFGLEFSERPRVKVYMLVFQKIAQEKRIATLSPKRFCGRMRIAWALKPIIADS
ncbi:hypothetical protein N7486_008009 [Penicillium sp. IBT 16267x]|nr:hypothetical protein N7486_008009 [Penicillium sp. IBT 16267x]